MSKFQQVEECTQDIDDFEVPMVDLAKQRLAEVWKLERYFDTGALFARMIASVRQPLNACDSALGNIAFVVSKLPDWEGKRKKPAQVKITTRQLLRIPNPVARAMAM